MMTERESLGSRLGFLLLSAGCAIGLGNVWRFPFIVGQHGGAAFVVLYLFFLILLGYPLMVMEMAVGRASRKSLYGSMEMAAGYKKAWKIIAAVLSCGCAILMMYYTTVTGWLVAYMAKFLNGTFSGKTPAEVGSVFDGLTGSGWDCAGYMLAVVLLGSLVCGIGLRAGVERISKVLMAGLFLLLVLLCVYAVCLPGASAGLKFYLLPQWNRLTLQAVPAAMAQAFFTLSVGIGSIAIFGSYVGKEHSLGKEALVVILLDTMVAILAGLVIFPVCASSGVAVQGGPGLIFVSLPNVFSQIPGGRWWGALFFLFLCFAAFTTVIGVFENLIAILIDHCRWSRMRASVVVCLGLMALSLPCALGFNVWNNIQPLGPGSTILDFEDYLVSDNLLPLGGVVLILFCCTRYGWGWDGFIREVNTGAGLKFPAKAHKVVLFVLPVLILILFAINFVVRWF